MKAKDRALQTKEHSMLYEEFFVAQGKLKLEASETTTRLPVQTGKLQVDGRTCSPMSRPRPCMTPTGHPTMEWLRQRTG